MIFVVTILREGGKHEAIEEVPIFETAVEIFAEDAPEHFGEGFSQEVDRCAEEAANLAARAAFAKGVGSGHISRIFTAETRLLKSGQRVFLGGKFRRHQVFLGEGV